MTDNESLTLAHPEVQEAKRRFEAVKGPRKISLTFDELFWYLEEERLTYKQLAGICGVRNQAIQQIYKRYFQELFGTREERWKSLRLARLAARSKEKETKTLSGTSLALVIGRATGAGCEVKGVVRTKNGSPLGIRPNQLLINGNLCLVINPSLLSNRPSYVYRSLTASSIYYSTLMNVDAVIVHINVEGYPEHFFVVPREIIRLAYFDTSPPTRKYIYFPVEELQTYRNLTFRVYYWQFEDAWHLLAPKTRAPVP